MKTYTSMIDEQGFTTVPAEICERLGVQPGSQIEWLEADGGFEVKPVPTPLKTLARAIRSILGAWRHRLGMHRR